MDFISISNDSSKGLFLIFLAIICNYLADVINCSVQKTLQDQKWIKWIVIFVLIFFTINFTSDPKADPFKLFGVSIMIFVLFVLFMKQNRYTFFISLFLLVIVFSLNQWITYFQSLDEPDKKKIRKLQEACTGFQILLILVLVSGNLWYLLEQKKDRSGLELDPQSKFDYGKFYFGIEACKHVDKKKEEKSGQPTEHLTPQPIPVRISAVK